MSKSDMISKYNAAVGEREAARARGDREAYLAAAARCKMLAQQTRTDRESAAAAALAEATRAENERKARRDKTRRDEAIIDRARRTWERAQEWPQCGQGVPDDWRDMLPARLRAMARNRE